MSRRKVPIAVECTFCPCVCEDERWSKPETSFSLMAPEGGKMEPFWASDPIKHRAIQWCWKKVLGGQQWAVPGLWAHRDPTQFEPTPRSEVAYSSLIVLPDPSGAAPLCPPRVPWLSAISAGLRLKPSIMERLALPHLLRWLLHSPTLLQKHPSAKTPTIHTPTPLQSTVSNALVLLLHQKHWTDHRQLKKNTRRRT